MSQLKKKPLFNPLGDTDVLDRRMIGGNTTNLNDFNNMKYEWVSDWYRQAMNNFWIPEEINLGVDIKDYRKLPRPSGALTTRSCRSSSSSTACNRRTCLPWASTSRPTR